MSRRKGFTLVELLVVIGIIAVLISLLLPSLNRARSQARNVKCLSSLRQLGLGFQQYAQAFKGVWPVARHEINFAGNATQPAQVVSNRWVDRIAEQITGRPMINMASMNNGGSNGDMMDRLREASVLWGCPEWGKATGDDALVSGDYIRIGYGMNPYGRLPDFGGGSTATDSFHRAFITAMPGNVNGGRFLKVTEYSKPSDRILLADSPQDYISNSRRTRGSWLAGDIFWPFEPTRTIGNCHFWVDSVRHARPGAKKNDAWSTGRYVNALFCDGHAQSVSTREAWNAVTNPGEDTAVTAVTGFGS